MCEVVFRLSLSLTHSSLLLPTSFGVCKCVWECMLFWRKEWKKKRWLLIKTARVWFTLCKIVVCDYVWFFFSTCSLSLSRSFSHTIFQRVMLARLMMMSCERVAFLLFYIILTFSTFSLFFLFLRNSKAFLKFSHVRGKRTTFANEFNDFDYHMTSFIHDYRCSLSLTLCCLSVFFSMFW